MLGWTLYMKRRGIKPEEFLKGCSNIEQAKQRFESKKVKAPDDATIIQYLESISKAENELNVIEVSIQQKINFNGGMVQPDSEKKSIPPITAKIESAIIVDSSTVDDQDDLPLKRGKSGKRKQNNDLKEKMEKEDEQE
jgi:hypothetical protein